ncbi:hypothetical protein F4777DRAFT_593497 [Nemania sp. FL0916]|nr:hypothetical protein F4777DRAFT_593497 [Nemania sp. FL0916]
MPASIVRLSLFWAALFSLLSAVAAYGPQYPTTLEVGIVFPRNETYSPVDAFPLVVAIQNSSLSHFLQFDMSLQWVIFKVDNESVDAVSELIEASSFQTDPPTTADQRYLVSATTQLNSTEGRFKLFWTLGVNNCSIVNVNPNGTSNIDVVNMKYSNSTYFTLKNAAQPPDLVAATSPETCASMAARVLNLTGYTPVPGVTPNPHLTPEEQKQCPILRNATVSPTPCSVRMNQTQAAILSASATLIACDTWPIDYPGYKAACEDEPSSATSLFNMAGVKATSGSSDAWTAEDQDDLEGYLGQVIFARQNVIELTLRQVFDGTDDDIDFLGRIIAGGRLLPRKYGGDDDKGGKGPLTPPNSTNADLTLTIEKAF